MTDPKTTEVLDEILTQLRSLNAAEVKRSQFFAWKEWLPALALAFLAGLGMLNFSDRLTGLETRLHDDIARLSDHIDKLATQQARDEGAAQRTTVSPAKPGTD